MYRVENSFKLPYDTLTWIYFEKVESVMTDDIRERFNVDLSDGIPKVTPRVEKPKKASPPSWTMIVYAGQIGTSVLVPLLLGIGIGRYVDAQQQSHPTWVLVGLGIGFFLSLVTLTSTVKDIINKVGKQ